MSSDNGRAMEASAPDVDTENHLTEMWMQSMEEIRAIQPGGCLILFAAFVGFS